MIFKYLIIVQLLFVSGFSVSVVFERVKRGDIDLQTCIENFDIHKDKIIRTEDSRAMGAKYLSEMDLDSREQCLRLCCETENCDVFVYEEKNAGSCYLFQCGPPEDFKCKFTHHANYTSAVLAVNRHLPDLESQIKLTKHEQDLSKLRKPEVMNTANIPMMPAQTTPSTATTTVKIKETVSNEVKIKTDNRKCSNYQFECRSTGECIAIYNACDGIPQCADGSDEALELQCPDSTTTSIPSQNHPNNGAPIVIPLEQQPARFASIPNGQSQDIYHQGIQVDPKISVPSRHEDFIRPDPLNAHSAQYEPQVLPQYQYLPQGQNNWMQHQSNQLQPQIPQYPVKNSHIFNHKENGLQVSDVGEASQMQYGDAREYPKLLNYYGSKVYDQPIPQLQENWPHNQQEYRAPQNGYQQEVNNIPGREMWPQHSPENKEKEVYKTQPVKELPPDWKIEKEIPKHEQDKMAHELKHSKEQFVKTGDTKEIKHSTFVKFNVPVDSVVEIEDGVAETPGGAVLSLTLGLIITSLMGILIGCRLRVVRRRLRRGGKSYAHDADYLVNGMYL